MPRSTRDLYPRSFQDFAYRAFTFSGLASQPVQLSLPFSSSDKLWLIPVKSLYPITATPTGLFTAMVWAPPLSLATTQGISSISSPPVTEMFHFTGFASLFRMSRLSARRVSPFGYPRFNGRLHLHVAFRSWLRPSSPPAAQASTVCLLYLYLLYSPMHFSMTRSFLETSFWWRQGDSNP